METIIAKGAFELASRGDGLLVRTTEYHCGAAHLTREELRELGFEITRPDDGLPASQVLKRLDLSALPPDLEPRGPALTDPGFVSPEGERADGFRLVLVREGLDVYADDYRAGETQFPVSTLEALGLAVRPRDGTRDAEPSSPEEGSALELCAARACELVAAFDAAAILRAEGTPEPVALLHAQSGSIEVVPFRLFRGRFSSPEARSRAEAVHADARRLGRIHLFFSSGEGRYLHFHLLRGGADGSSPRAVPPTAWGLTLEELDEANARRRAWVKRLAGVVRVLPAGSACPQCARPRQRLSYHFSAPDEDVVEVELCRACGLSSESSRVPLVALSPAHLALFLTPVQVARVADAATQVADVMPAAP